jgi:hypothetical protein
MFLLGMRNGENVYGMALPGQFMYKFSDVNTHAAIVATARLA